ncbi:hypothetical protein [Bradyrhizobium liaoningense]|uniref:hypothetical protein n=1 Tax=Bradyrhizobium liaoningense TaxID=43992 RepID=UPI001BAE0D33|nr:hypothetical protein [Bradyrhizobium liaoningense]MBR0822957.1 hypothetical protein [Bradyrhizobium liaoningense]
MRDVLRLSGEERLEKLSRCGRAVTMAVELGDPLELIGNMEFASGDVPLGLFEMSALHCGIHDAD